MKYFIISEAGSVIECHCITERYLAFQMENPSPVANGPVQFVPWRRDVSARDSGGLKAFTRSATRPLRDGAAQQSVNQLSVCRRPMRVSHSGRILPLRFMAAGARAYRALTTSPEHASSAPLKARPPGPSPTAQARSPAAPHAPFPRRPARGKAGARPSPPAWHVRAR